MLNASLRRLVRSGNKKQPSMQISSPLRKPPLTHFSVFLEYSALTLTQKATGIGIMEVPVCPNLLPGCLLHQISSQEGQESACSVTVTGLSRGAVQSIHQELPLPLRKGHQPSTVDQLGAVPRGYATIHGRSRSRPGERQRGISFWKEQCSD